MIPDKIVTSPITTRGVAVLVAHHDYILVHRQDWIPFFITIMSRSTQHSLIPSPGQTRMPSSSPSYTTTRDRASSKFSGVLRVQVLRKGQERL